MTEILYDASNDPRFVQSREYFRQFTIELRAALAPYRLTKDTLIVYTDSSTRSGACPPYVRYLYFEAPASAPIRTLAATTEFLHSFFEYSLKFDALRMLFAGKLNVGVEFAKGYSLGHLSDHTRSHVYNCCLKLTLVEADDTAK